MTPLAPVGGAVFQLDAFNVDGANNANRAHGDPLKSIKDLASLSNDLVPVDYPGGNTIYERARMKLLADGENAIGFRGVYDQYTIPNSDTRFAFLHQTGVFDLFIALRARGHGVPEPWFGNMTNTANDKGLSMLVHEDGSLTVALGNGAAPVIFSDQQLETKVPRNVPSMLLLRGTGAGLTASANLFDFDYVRTFTGSLGSGNAARAFALGGTTGFSGGGASYRPLQADLFFMALYSSNLSANNLATMKLALQSRMPTT